jgi:hypothetical protein
MKPKSITQDYGIQNWEYFITDLSIVWGILGSIYCLRILL